MEPYLNTKELQEALSKTEESLSVEQTIHKKYQFQIKKVDFINIVLRNIHDSELKLALLISEKLLD